LLVVDAVLVGCGRSGEPLTGAACDPDLVCLGKALGGGIPASAVVARAEVAKVWDRGGEVIHTSTFVGHPLSCVAIEATLGMLDDADLVAEHEAWSAALEHLPVRGCGLLWALPTPDPFSLAERLLARGIVVTPGPRCIALTPAIGAHEFAEELVEALA
jgi:acetylornithine/succinyldiaminopimelate/putrescine aminotransferase